MTTLVAVTDTRTAEQRWADWVARGVAQDRITQRRAVGVAITIASALVLWLVIALTRG